MGTTKTNGKNGTEMAIATNAVASDTYMELINELPLRRIKTAAAHAKAAKIVLRLSSQKLDRGATEYLDVLIDLIADFEKRAEQRIDSGAVSAADLVRHRIEARGMSVNALARMIGVPQSNLS